MSEPITPPTVGVTPEAAEALGLNLNGDDGTDSATEFEDGIGEFPFPQMGQPMSTGDTIDEVVDAEIVDDEPQPQERARRSRRENPASHSRTKVDREPTTPRDAKTGPPSLDEWTRFFSRVVLRVVTEWYLTLAFRGIDEDALTDKELDRLALTDDERQLIAVPFAELSHKSKFMRKHGRTIVASGDAVNALIVMAAWASRVNRIAAKYRPKQARSRTVINGSSGQGTPEAETTSATGSTGGRFPNGFNGFVVPGSS